MARSLCKVGAALALMLGIFQGVPARADRISIVIGDVEYTRDGQVDDEASRAIQIYIEYLSSRLRNTESQSVADYMRKCTTAAQRAACALPDFYVQLQFAERREEVQIAGVIDQKVDGKNLPHNLDPIRVRRADLTDGLSSVVKNIEAVISSISTPTQRVHIGTTCFGSGSDEVESRRRPPPEKSQGVTPEISPLVQYADRLGKVVEAVIGSERRILVTTKKASTAECSSPDALQTIAKAAGADAILMGRIFGDDHGGLFVTPQVYVEGGDRAISLRPILVPAELDAGPSYVAVARKLVAATDALLDSPNRSDLVRAIGDGTEVPYYLDKAQKYLSSSPPQYDLADALLDLAMWKAKAQARPYLLYASSLTGRLRFKEAVQVLRAGIENASEPRDLYAALAENHARSGDLVGARSVYEEALSKRILGQDALLGIARTYFAATPPDRSQAIDYALRAARPQNAVSTDAYSLAGEVALSANDFKKAEQYLQEGRDLFPDSSELASRLSNLYERWAAEELKKGNYQTVTDVLTKSIKVFPASKKYYDLASVELEQFIRAGDGDTGYRLASEHYKLASDIAHSEGTLLSDFPWLLPNWAEVLIFEGKFARCKEVVQELFFTLNSDPTIRSGTDPNDVRLIGAFLNAAAEVLSSGSAIKELYLFENLVKGMDLSTIPWNFNMMKEYLDKDYPKIVPELEPDQRDARVTIVKQLIERVESEREK